MKKSWEHMEACSSCGTVNGHTQECGEWFTLNDRGVDMFHAGMLGTNENDVDEDTRGNVYVRRT